MIHTIAADIARTIHRSDLARRAGALDIVGELAYDLDDLNDVALRELGIPADVLDVLVEEALASLEASTR